MKTYRLVSIPSPDTHTLWDSFVAYMDNYYFEGAVDLLKVELVRYEYEKFCLVYDK